MRRTSTRTGGGPGEEVQVGIPGDDAAEDHEGEAPGMAFLVWDTGDRSCGEIGLQLVVPDMTAAQAKQEIVKVAEGLTG